MSVVNNSFISERLSSLRNFLNEQLDIVQKELVDNYDTNMNTFIKRYVSEMSHVGVNVLTKSVIDGEVLLPIHPQYSISFNDKKFNEWLNKIAPAGIDNEDSV